MILFACGGYLFKVRNVPMVILLRNKTSLPQANFKYLYLEEWGVILSSPFLIGHL